MGMLTWMRDRRRSMASCGVLTVAATAVTTLAVLHPGYPVADVELNDGGVWITNQSRLLVGHFNHESLVLDAGLRARSSGFDIVQSGRTVLVVDPENSTLTPIDPAGMVTLGDAVLPEGGEVSLGASTVAVLEPATGSLWIAPAGSIEGFTPKVDPVAELGKGAHAVVGTNGSVHAVSPEQGVVFSYDVDAAGYVTDPVETRLEGLSSDARVSLTSVGDTPIVWSATDDVLYIGADRRGLDVKDARLQQPSARADHVALATTTDLLLVPLGGRDGAEVAVVPAGGASIADAEGRPAEPVNLNGCVYAAWAGIGRFVRDCTGDDLDLESAIDGVSPTADLRFRVNRDVVVLNDAIAGSAWLAAEALERIDNWDDVTPPDADRQEEEEQTTELLELTSLPERPEENHPPVAFDDEFGARPGRATVLPVLDNDTDPDGDVLTAAQTGEGPSVGTVAAVYGGRALQLTLPEDAAGFTSFTYEAVDGRGPSAEATVSVEIVPWDTNRPPKQQSFPVVSVERGGQVTYGVLPNWIDPDGDSLFLVSASVDGDDEVEFTPDGTVTFRATGDIQGHREVALVISDGREDVAGVLTIDVKPVGSVGPETQPDHVVARVGELVTVQPLANDTSPSGAPLRLAGVKLEGGGATVTPDYLASTFAFVSQAPGAYYIQYLVTDGAHDAVGLARVDVLAAAAEGEPPIAVRDIALLPAGRDVQVNVLENDVDPVGGVLVVQSVTVPDGAGVSAAVVDHRVVQIADQSGISEPVTLQYRISNGAQQATAEIVVLPVPAPARLRPPVATDDAAVVRVGDVVTIHVLDNDHHPTGDVLKLAPDLVESPDPVDGEIFVSENRVRFRAGSEAKTVYATYEVVDSAGQKDAGYITIQIMPMDAGTNATPHPRELTARVLAGQTVRIPVPLDGIDSDGDSVELIGQATPPSKGRIVSVGADYLVYEAFADSAGLDTFTYSVSDRLGRVATAPVRVGIAVPEATNQRPFAMRDVVTLRPNRAVSVPVLANDSDPDGDELTLVIDGLEVPDELQAEVSGSSVIVRTSDALGPFSVLYRVRDPLGAEAVGAISITVDETVPLLSPIARDDRVTATQLVAGESTVDIDVRANDDDPDGTRDALTVRLHDESDTASVLPDGTMRVTLAAEPQLFTYSVTDIDGNAASAFVFVPGTADLRPVLARTAPLEVVSGETLEIPINDHVVVAGGGTARLTEVERVKAVNANGASLVKDATTLLFTSADGYFGDAAITFEVTDGTDAADPAGRTATLTLPITVLPPENEPPTFTDSTIEVAPGEGAATLNLRELSADPNEGHLQALTFALAGGAPSGWTVRIDGATLSVSAPVSAKGEVAQLGVTVTDPENASVTGTVSARVTASTRFLAVANDDVVARAAQGRTERVSVLANDVNPFPETPLRVLDARVETGSASVAVEGDVVAVTPAADFVGALVVRYRIGDATNDPEREVEGRIRVTVQGKPDAPGRPAVTSEQDRTVVLSWTPPSNNGAEITGYTVRSDRGTTTACPATTCTISGLTNNVEYVFTVTATNWVGESDPSRASDVARPDARPNTPQAPVLKFGDRSLSITWTTPTTPGSPVSSYDLEISPSPLTGSSQRTGLTGNSFTWEGLENGTAYTVRVRAHNRAPEPSNWSVFSAPEIPAGPPFAPATPATARLDPDQVNLQARMRVSWSAPGSNGDAIASYVLTVLRGGSVVRTVEGIAPTATSFDVPLDASTSDYTFTVAARNKAGLGPASPASAPRRAFVAPGAPAAVTATEGNNTVSVSWGAAPGNGASASELRYEYSVNNGSWRSDWLAGGGSATSGTIGNGVVPNNGTYTVRVRAYTSLDGVRYDGAASAASNAVAPYGPVGTPSVNISASGTNITYSWSAPGRNGRDIRVQISIDGGGWRDVGLSGSETHNRGHSFTGSIKARAIETQAPGRTGPESWTPTARTADPPPPRITVSKGPLVTSGGGCTVSLPCNKFYVVLEQFGGNERVTLRYHHSGGWWSEQTVTTRGDGSLNLDSDAFIGPAASNSWNTPYYVIGTRPNGATVRSNDTGW